MRSQPPDRMNVVTTNPKELTRSEAVYLVAEVTAERAGRRRGRAPSFARENASTTRHGAIEDNKFPPRVKSFSDVIRQHSSPRRQQGALLAPRAAVARSCTGTER